MTREHSQKTPLAHPADPHSYLYPICNEPMPSSFSNPDQASLRLEIEAAKIFDLFDEFYIHTRHDLSKQRNIDDLSEDEQNCLVRVAMRTVELDKSLAKGIEGTRLTLRSWMAAFEASPRTEKNRISHISTQTFFFCVWIWVATWRDASAVLVDRFEPQFEYFTDLCEQYLEIYNTKAPIRRSFPARDGDTAHTVDTPPAFSLGSGVVTCLVAIVEQCRNSCIRRRCLATLQKINLRGIFDTGYLVAFLQAIVDHEEQAAVEMNPDLDLIAGLQACDIPEPARILEVVMSPSYQASNFDFYKKKHLSMIYVSGQEPGTDAILETREQIIPVP
jgi:hypothetical protein